jgi:hypothetical protein
VSRSGGSGTLRRRCSRPPPSTRSRVSSGRSAAASRRRAAEVVDAARGRSTAFWTRLPPHPTAFVAVAGRIFPWTLVDAICRSTCPGGRELDGSSRTASPALRPAVGVVGSGPEAVDERAGVVDVLLRGGHEAGAAGGGCPRRRSGGQALRRPSRSGSRLAGALRRVWMQVAVKHRVHGAIDPERTRRSSAPCSTPLDAGALLLTNLPMTSRTGFLAGRSSRRPPPGASGRMCACRITGRRACSTIGHIQRRVEQRARSMWFMFGDRRPWARRPLP